VVDLAAAALGAEISFVGHSSVSGVVECL
jgi:hypothetical protein